MISNNFDIRAPKIKGGKVLKNFPTQDLTMDTFFINVKLGWVPIDGYILDECQIGLGAKLQGGAGVLGAPYGLLST